MPNTVLGKVSLTPKGIWLSNVTYQALDIVQYAGSSYLVLKECLGVRPAAGETYMLLASKGDKGDTGKTGDTGGKGDPGNRGINGVAVAADGQYAFNVSEAGDLIVSYTGTEAPDLYIANDGTLRLRIA